MNSAAMRSKSNGVTPSSNEKTDAADSTADTFFPVRRMSWMRVDCAPRNAVLNP